MSWTTPGVSNTSRGAIVAVHTAYRWEVHELVQQNRCSVGVVGQHALALGRRTREILQNLGIVEEAFAEEHSWRHGRCDDFDWNVTALAGTPPVQAGSPEHHLVEVGGVSRDVSKWIAR